MQMSQEVVSSSSVASSLEPPSLPSSPSYVSPSVEFQPHFSSSDCCEHYDKCLTHEKCGVCPETGITVYRPKTIPEKKKDMTTPRTRKKIIYDVVEKLVGGSPSSVDTSDSSLSSGSIISSNFVTNEETSVELDEPTPSSSDFSVSLSSVVTRLGSLSPSTLEDLQLEETMAPRCSLSTVSFDETQSENSQASY